MHCQGIACSFLKHLEIKDHLPQHPTAKGKDSGISWYQRSTGTMKDQEQVSADAQIAAESQGTHTVLIPQNLIKGAKETRAS